MSVQAAFYFDLRSPQAYLAAERILHVLPGPAQWRPIHAERLPEGALGAFRCEQEVDAFREDVARRAQALGLQPLRWPAELPFDSAFAMRVATYASSIGRAVPFAQAAFRQAYAGGRSLADRDSVLIAAAACEMHPTAVLRAGELRSVADELELATTAAVRAGVVSVPAVLVGEQVHEGGRVLEDAAAQMSAEAD
ncbi:MAG TPA: DsbA family protein [Solirubrobacteraceae bacterium]